MVPRKFSRSKDQESEIYNIYCSGITNSLIDKTKSTVGLEGKWRCRIFPVRLVLWLMLFERLNPKHTLNAALQEVLLRKPTELLNHLRPWQRQRISSNTAGYSKARSRLPVPLLKVLIEQLIERILQRFSQWSQWNGRRVFLLDGTTFRLQHSKEIIQKFGLPKNQLGEGYWPVMLVVLAHDLITGIALRPAWGAKNGRNTTSEQSLAKDVMKNLPQDSVIVGDQNFAIFSFAFHAVTSGHQVLMRVQANRIKSILGRTINTNRRKPLDEIVTWRPTYWDKHHNQDVSAQSKIEGRFIAVRHSSGNRKFTFFLFTTLTDIPVEALYHLYLRRWNIETDLRTIKKTVGMAHFSSKSVQMTEKELLIGIAAYSLIRASIASAAILSGIDPRDISFSRALDTVNASLPLIIAINKRDKRKIYSLLCDIISTCVIPRVPKRPNEPRFIRPKTRNAFPYFRGTRAQARKKYLP